MRPLGRAVGPHLISKVHTLDPILCCSGNFSCLYGHNYLYMIICIEDTLLGGKKEVSQYHIHYETVSIKKKKRAHLCKVGLVACILMRFSRRRVHKET